MMKEKKSSGKVLTVVANRFRLFRTLRSLPPPNQAVTHRGPGNKDTFYAKRAPPRMYGCQAPSGVRYLDSWLVSAVGKVSSWRRRRRHGGGDGVGRWKGSGLPGSGKSLRPY